MDHQKGHRLLALLRYSNEHKGMMIKAGFYSVINKIFDIFPEILIGLAIDVVVEKEQSFLANLGVENVEYQLAILAFLTFIVWVCESLTEYGAVVGWRNIAQEIQHKLRIHGISHLQKLSLSWYEGQNSGRLLSILNDDVNQVERFINDGLHKLIQLLVSSILIGVVFFYLSPLVALFAILPIPIIVLGGLHYRKGLASRYSEVRAMAAELGGRLSATIQGVVTIRAVVAEKVMVQKVSAESEAYIAANREAIKLSSAFVPIIRMAVLAGFLVTLVLGGLKTLNGELAASAYTVLVFLTQRLLWPFTYFGDMLDLYERSMASAMRVLGLIHEPLPEETGEGEGSILGSISFENLSFAYESGNPIIQEFNLSIKAGEFIGIVGPTGSGKSTLVKLLLRFYKASSGTIKIDDNDIYNLNTTHLRRSIGYVGQEDFLMDESIRENLSLGKEDITEKELIEALQIAEAKDFVWRLPEKLDTQIGERGQKLSGGQRQRLNIARGVLGNPPILIFDEATSAVDNETEEAIQNSITSLAKDRTLIVIAHRLSTIRHAHKIIVLDEGQLIQEGSHDELCQQEGLYKKLWNLQTGSKDLT